MPIMHPCFALVYFADTKGKGLMSAFHRRPHSQQLRKLVNDIFRQ